MKLLATITLLFGLTRSLIVKDNVVFYKRNDVSTTRAKWLVTFVLDLYPYSQFIELYKEDIKNAAVFAETATAYYKHTGEKEYSAIFGSLFQEVQHLNETQLSIQSSLMEYKSLHSLTKRSILPFVGKILSFTFGTLTSQDLSSIHSAISSLNANQQNILHLVEQNLSVLNVSRVQIAENRQAVLELIKSLHKLDIKLNKAVEMLNKEIFGLKYFLEIYLQLDVIVEELKTMMQRAMFHLETLRMHLNLLSLNHLSPTTVSPSNLRSVLSDVKSHLPPTLTFPIDHNQDIWSFYKKLSCNAILDGNKLIIIMAIPLLEVNDILEVYEIFNIPLPVSGGYNSTDLTAQYSLEAQGIMVDNKRTKYALLSSEELAVCGNPMQNYCTQRSPIFPINLSKLCVVNLFLGNERKIKRYCKAMVSINTRLPSAHYLFNGQWAVASRTNLTFTIVCHGKTGATPTITIRAPLDVLHLKQTCIGSNENMLLSSYFDGQSNYNVVNKEAEILQLSKISKSLIWAPLKRQLPNLTKMVLPDSLRKLKQIPLGQFIQSLTPLSKVNTETGGWPAWAMFSIITGVCLLLGVVTVIMIRYRNFLRYPSCLAIRASRDLSQIEAQNCGERSVPAQKGLTSTDGGQRTPEPTDVPSDDEGTSNLYPRLGIVLKK